MVMLRRGIVFSLSPKIIHLSLSLGWTRKAYPAIQCFVLRFPALCPHLTHPLERSAVFHCEESHLIQGPSAHNLRSTCCEGPLAGCAGALEQENDR
eukprot:3380344-Amphidinium_carterae.1